MGLWFDDFCFQDDSANSRQKKDAEANWKLQVYLCQI